MRVFSRHQSSQACSAAKTINRGRRRIIKVSRILSEIRSNCCPVLSQMLVIMLVVYYICWGSWLSSKLILVRFQIIKYFYAE